MGTRAVIGEPKTKAGYRVVDLDGATVGSLIAHQLRQATERDNAGEGWTESGLVFCREDGTMLRPE